MRAASEACSEHPKACIFFWLVVTIVSSVLLGVSFDTLDMHSYGLRYDGVKLVLDDSKLWTNGRHYIGVGSQFIQYPRNMQYEEFSAGSRLDVWSKDGQLVYVDAGFYYRLRPESIVSIYRTYTGDDWRVIVRGIAAETLRDVATTFDTLEFFTNRSLIDTTMQRRLSDRLYLEANSNLTIFNLLGIDVPPLFETAVLNKLITAQDVLTLQLQRAANVTRAQITVVDAEAAANVTIINANANATGLLTEQAAQASIFRSYAESRARALYTISRSLNFTAPAEMLQFVYTDVIRGGDKVLIDVPQLVLPARK